MKLSNFRDYKVVTINGSPREYEYALVDVTETKRFLCFKRDVITTREIACDNGIYWYFLDTGMYTPERYAEDLCRAYKLSNALNKINGDVAQLGEQLPCTQ